MSYTHKGRAGGEWEGEKLGRGTGGREREIPLKAESLSLMGRGLPLILSRLAK